MMLRRSVWWIRIRSGEKENGSGSCGVTGYERDRSSYRDRSARAGPSSGNAAYARAISSCSEGA